MNEITVNRVFSLNSKEITDTVNHLKNFFKNNNYFSITVDVHDWILELGSSELIKKTIMLKFSDDRELTMFVMKFHDHLFTQGSTTYLSWTQHNIVFGLSK